MTRPEATARYDRASGIVRSHFKGLMTLDVLSQYEWALREQVALARRVSSRVLLLFDSQESIVQPADIITRMREIGDGVYQPGDLRAVVVGSVLLKMQAARAVLGAAGEEVFRTMEEAEAWLKA